MPGISAIASKKKNNKKIKRGLKEDSRGYYVLPS